METRVVHNNLELRTLGTKKKIVGYAAVFGALSEDLGGYRERIEPNAFHSSLSQDIFAYAHHDNTKILGRTKSKTLFLNPDSKGLYFEITPPKSALGREMLRSVERGDLDGASFGFYIRKDEWQKRDGGNVHVLHDINLQEVSIVAKPAYPQTSLTVRSLEEFNKAEDYKNQATSIDIMRKRLNLIGGE